MRKTVVAIAAVLLLGAFGAAQTQKSTPNAARATQQKILKARPLPLNDVRLTGGPLKVAQEADADLLLNLEPDRMLAYLRQRAGLESKAKGYGGWDGAGRQLTGHIAGHYLSAVSYMYAATGDERFKDRADYIVNDLKKIQDAQGDGYIGALMDAQGVDGKKRFEDLSKGIIKSGGFDLNGLWSPWYVQHKIFAGLRDAYHYTGNKTALDVEVKFAGWAEKILSPLNDQQIQQMLATEFGGMNEVLADLYADTGDKKWLVLSGKFEHNMIVDPLAEGKDIMAGKHGNTLVPKMIGELKRYEYTGDEKDGKAAKFFWDEIALHHSFATGGDGKNEYFGSPDKMNDMIDGRTAETCNVYNMIKFARELFAVNPDTRYADFHERALFNHILSSQDPNDGTMSYMVPVGRGVQHEYNNTESFTCCVGSGFESHALHGYGIYFESPNKLWVSLYAPSTANWETAGVKLEMATDFPIGDRASLTVTPKMAKRFTLALRRPYWAGEGFTVKVNGVALTNISKPDSYVEITRVWKAGDKLDLVLPKTLRTEPLPDNPNRLALMWGPLVLAGDLGPEIERPRGRRQDGAQAPAVPEVPVFVAAEQNVNNWLKPVSSQPGTFRTVAANLGLKSDIEFKPFYKLPRHRYAIYWDVFTPDEWKKKSEAYAAEQEKKKKLEAATVAFAQPGQMQTERDFNQQGEESTPLQAAGRYGRQATKWFSFDLPVESAHPMKLVVTFNNEGRRPGTFSVLVDGQKVGEQKVERRTPEQDLKFFDVEYSLPAELVKDKQKVTVKFEAGTGSVSGVFGIRMVRADAGL